MRVHLLGLPHTHTTRDYDWCAYTAKLRKLSGMLTKEGHEVILYASDESEALCSELVPLVTSKEQDEWFAHYDFTNDVFNDFDPNSVHWKAFNERAIGAITVRSEPGDILGITMGLSQKPVADALSELMAVEVGVGYSGVFAPYRVFESWAWRAHLSGKYDPSDDVRLYDETIPNFYEVDDFPEGKGDGGYYLFIGRLIGRKGPHIAAEACKRIGAKLIVAGQGVGKAEPGRITCQDGTVLEGDVEYVGRVDPEQRAELYGGAIATFVPTLYLEPFGGVSVESQLCGTPAIVTPSGGLVENVRHGQTGFICSTLAQFANAAESSTLIDRAAIRKDAIDTWSTEVLAPRYVSYFDRLATLSGAGWYAA